MAEAPTPDVFARRLQAAREAQFCEHVLAKSASNVLLTTLGHGGAVEGWTHYPADDVFDPESGSLWYYHCHLPARDEREHGHFHCFVRPQGKDGPIHHLAGIGVDAAGKAYRLFTVNRWMTGDDFIEAERAGELLGRFDVHLDRPSYLVNRWVSAILRLYEADIRTLLWARARTLARHGREHGKTLAEVLDDRSLQITSEAFIDLHDTARALERQAPADACAPRP
ncbi:DUF6969 family protein [Thauera linaloolentis]|uniref:DUF6969 domain-containing protein n=1 Tax=Thauera linaloolentis (strain DSM 12138 / JCM 21573 / CCUG 41526 / CIP 105981 / IAM 15112 / NBRC 102519 / 47Lol) TaxID=1123367 RepID=N6YRP1_THAL4|nr:hypothetical protein [Thauera linaloolentis]ENO84853.1 hypothetical protein C666_16480 [Thauera linaloolentis 47Lol = DSM 12138]MCM8564847.1 hypothetical protein [Thauera linaloolentis]